VKPSSALLCNEDPEANVEEIADEIVRWIQ
jgi:hypothetical protein